MKRIFTTSLLLTGFCMHFSSLNAQTIVTNDTIRLECVLSPVGDEFIFEELDIKNNSSKSYDFKISKVIAAGDTVTGTKTFFCDNVCYGEDVYVSTAKKTIAANSSFTSFSNHYKPLGNSGTSIVKYIIFNVNSPDEKVYVVFKITAKASPAAVPTGTFVVNLDFPSSVKEQERSTILSVAPNPANNKMFVSLNNTNASKSTLKVYDLLGNVIIEKTVFGTEDKIEMDTEKFSNGVYYLKLEVSDKAVSTKKFVVSHQ